MVPEMVPRLTGYHPVCLEIFKGSASLARAGSANYASTVVTADDLTAVNTRDVTDPHERAVYVSDMNSSISMLHTVRM